MHALIPFIACNSKSCVKIYTPFSEEAECLDKCFEARGGIQLKGIYESKGCAPTLVTTDPKKAAEGVDMVLMVLPAFAHGSVITDLAPFLSDNIIIGAMPARSGLEYQTWSILKETGLEAFTIFGLQTLPWACRIEEFGTSVEVLGVKEMVGVASIPRDKASSLAGFFTEILGLPIFPMDNMLELSLANVGQIIHPGIMYGLFRNYSGESFTESDIPLFYNGVTEEIATILEQLSDEVLQLKNALQKELGSEVSFDSVLSVREWLLQSYTDKIENKETLSSAFRSNQAYHGLKAPVKKTDKNGYVPDFQSRYLTEDIPTGLVVSVGLARLVGLKTPVIDQVISEVSGWMKKEYLRNGRLEGNNILETRAPQNYGIENTGDLKNIILK
jgi:NAD/NADP octopine/nopaline dehydrogenase, alpha-helical domain